MKLYPIDTVENISPADFKKNYYNVNKPVVIKDLAKKWPAYDKWNWEYFKQIVGDQKVALYK